jgi:hypothetical protein
MIVSHLSQIPSDYCNMIDQDKLVLFRHKLYIRIKDLGQALLIRERIASVKRDFPRIQGIKIANTILRLVTIIVLSRWEMIQFALIEG